MMIYHIIKQVNDGHQSTYKNTSFYTIISNNIFHKHERTKKRVQIVCWSPPSNHRSRIGTTCGRGRSAQVEVHISGFFKDQTGLKTSFGFSQIFKNRFYVKPVRFETGFGTENVRFKLITGSV